MMPMRDSRRSAWGTRCVASSDVKSDGKNEAEEIRVAVRYGVALRPSSGLPRETVRLDGTPTVRDLLAEIARRHPDLGPALASPVTVIAQGAHLRLNSRLADGEEVALLIPVAGG
jgi:molybdopterin converting factor small subunit